MKKSDKWYDTRLRKYFYTYYGEYDNIAEFYPNPSPNKWAFIIRDEFDDRVTKVVLTCNDIGEVTERTCLL